MLVTSWTIVEEFYYGYMYWHVALKQEPQDIYIW